MNASWIEDGFDPVTPDIATDAACAAAWAAKAFPFALIKQPVVDGVHADTEPVMSWRNWVQESSRGLLIMARASELSKRYVCGRAIMCARDDHGYS